MRAGKIIHDGGFGPEDVLILKAVLAEAWHKIDSRGVPDSLDRATAREHLALIIVALAKTAGIGTTEFTQKVIDAFDRVRRQ